MERDEVLVMNIREFFQEAGDGASKGRFTAAYILLFKALSAIADLTILRKKGIIPKNHTQRFNVLPFVDPGLMNRLSEAFEEYVNAFSKQISKESFDGLKEVVKRYGKNVGAL